MLIPGCVYGAGMVSSTETGKSRLRKEIKTWKGNNCGKQFKEIRILKHWEAIARKCDLCFQVRVI